MDYGRLHWFRPDELTPEQRDYYDQLTSGPRDAAELDALRDGEPTPTLSESENTVRELTQALVIDRDLDDTAFAAAEKAIGAVKIFDTVSLVGHYQHTALAIRVWRVPLREGATPVFGS